MSPPEIFSWIILSLSLHYNKIVWHVLVNKIIVSLIISHTAVCFFAFLVTLQTRYDLSLFSIISIISEMKTRDLLHDHKLKGKCSSWNLTTDSIFFNWIVFTSSFFLWKYIFSILFVLETPSDLGVHLEFPWNKKWIQNVKGSVSTESPSS